MIGKPRCKLDWNMGEMIHCLENIEISKIYSRRDKKSKQPIIREGTENATSPNHQAPDGFLGISNVQGTEKSHS